ncbi:hypothetical protein BGZ76_002657 [Entomortierella beljakovae]|nr:hypothetical protein BGZ76_002657 [Entomortierella beljakovae]
MLRTVRKVSSGTNLTANATHGSSPSSPAMRRKRKETECLLKLERVLGLTSNKPMVLSVNSTHDMVAYAAGCIVVLYNHKIDKQVGLLCSSTLKKLSSADSGAVGTSGPGGMNSRSHGGSPRVGPANTSNSNQWLNSAFSGATINPMAGLMPMAISDTSIASSFGTSNPSSNKNIKPKPISCLSFSPDGQFLAIGETGHQPRILIWEVASQMLVGELQGHKFGVQAVQFSPNSKYLVSLGFQHDGYLHVWNWRTNVQIASNKITTKVNALAFSADGSYFVTAGLRHIKYWYLNVNTNKRGVGATLNTQVLDGRSGILGEQRDGNYVDAVCSSDGRYTYAITSNGVLCSFSEGRTMERWVSLHTRGAYSINLNEDSIICACTDGIVRLFKHETLEYIGTLPKPNPVGPPQEPRSNDQENEEGTAKPFYSDVLASQYDPSSNCLICIYSDRSLYVWNISDPQNAVISRIHSSHSDCVWGAEIIPPSTDNSDVQIYPPDTFLTYSADGSIIFWNLDENITSIPPTSNPKDSESVTQGIKSEILNVLYVDDNCRSWIQSPENFDGLDPGFNVIPVECGVRTARVSADGKLLASGDKGGNLRVHEISSMKQLTYQEAHETEILAIDFTDTSSSDSPSFVATAGRDRLLHVFDVSNDYALVQTLDDHSSSITCIKFTCDGSRMMSCGADKSIVFRNSLKAPEGYSYQPYHQATGRATFYDMGINNESQTISVVAGDRRFNVFALDSGKSIKSFKAETKGDDLAAGMAEMCSMTHISLDPTGTIAAASGSDKSVRVYDLLSGTCLAHMICHSELVTNIRFMNGFDRIISTGADGCILIWRLSKEVVRKIQTRIQENVTLPGYLQSKAAEKTITPLAPTPSPRPLRLIRSKEKVGANFSEYSGTSRRNSAASIVSDYDTRTGELSDDASELKYGKSTRDQQVDEVPRGAFTPVTSSAAGSPITPSTRSRISGSISMTPMVRSRQSSTSNPSATRLRPTSSAQPEQPQWNRGHVKERVKSSPSTSTNAFGQANPRPLTPKLTIKNNWLAPANSRPRATSLTVPTEATLKMDNAKERGRSSKRQSLSDYSREDPPTAPGDNDDDVLSDDTESGFDDGLGFVPDSHHTNSNINNKSSISVISPRDTAKSIPRDQSLKDIVNQKSLIQEPGHEASETDNIDETGASDGRDGDDEDADEDESVSDTGSDNDQLSPLRINLSPGLFRQGNLGSPNSNLRIGDYAGGFDEGEKIGDSPRSDTSQQIISPSGRVISIRPTGAGRRSISSIFLTAHVAATLMGLAQEHAGEDKPESEIKNKNKDNIDQPHLATSILHGGSGIANQTPTANDQPAQDASNRKSMLDVSNAEISNNKEINIQDEQDRPLEQRLNLQSLNAAALKWKQRSMSSGSNDNGKAGNGLEREFSKNQHDKNHQDVNSDDFTKEAERKSENLVEVDDYKGHSGSQAPKTMKTMSGDSRSSEFAEENRSTSKTHVKKGSQSIEGILASPVVVKSPENTRASNRNSSRSLGQAMSTLFGEVHDNSEYARAEKQSISTEKDNSSEQSLRDAFDRISFLISHKAMTATRIDNRRYVENEKIQKIGGGGGGGGEADSANGTVSAVSADDIERKKEAKKWMLETREGLLNLVGEVQGHLWALERDKRLEGMDD